MQRRRSTLAGDVRALCRCAVRRQRAEYGWRRTTASLSMRRSFKTWPKGSSQTEVRCTRAAPQPSTPGFTADLAFGIIIHITLRELITYPLGRGCVLYVAGLGAAKPLITNDFGNLGVYFEALFGVDTATLSQVIARLPINRTADEEKVSERGRRPHALQ